MEVFRFQVGKLRTNCYLVTAEDGRQHPAPDSGLLIDPGDGGEYLERELNSRQVRLEKIVLTHGHFDHIGAVQYLKERFHPEILIHREDSRALTDPARNFSGMMGMRMVQVPADRCLEDGSKISLGELEIQVLHTPGHTPGGICLLCGNVLFSGDTLYAGNIGRTDLSGDMNALLHSIRSKLMVLEDSVRVLPGHGPETTIGWERRNNPFLLM